MNPYAKYQEKSAPCWTRIDMLLALYEGAVERCQNALHALEQSDAESAGVLLRKARLIVMGLISGVVPDGDPVTTSILQLLDFVQHALEQGQAEEVRGAVAVLKTLRDGFQQIRPEAVALERSGAISAAGDAPAVHALA